MKWSPGVLATQASKQANKEAAGGSPVIRLRTFVRRVIHRNAAMQRKGDATQCNAMKCNAIRCNAKANGMQCCNVTLQHAAGNASGSFESLNSPLIGLARWSHICIYMYVCATHFRHRHCFVGLSQTERLVKIRRPSTPCVIHNTCKMCFLLMKYRHRRNKSCCGCCTEIGRFALKNEAKCCLDCTGSIGWLGWLAWLSWLSWQATLAASEAAPTVTTK